MTPDIEIALSALSTGIYVLTTGGPDRFHAMVVSWVTQAGYEPPLVLAAVRVNRFLHDLVPKFGRFGLNVPPVRDMDLMPAIKQAPPGQPIQGLDIFTLKTGSPLLKPSLACLDCRLVEAIRPGDHTLFIGEVVDARVFLDEPPLTTRDYGHTYLGKY